MDIDIISLARRFGVKKTYIYSLIRKKKIPFYKEGKIIKFREEDLPEIKKIILEKKFYVWRSDV